MVPGESRGDGVGGSPTRHSSESRNPRNPTPRDSALTPHCGQPLRQPKRGRDVDPGFRRGDGVGSATPSVIPAFAGNHATPTPRDSPLTPHCGQPLRPPKRVRDVDPGFRRGDGVGSAPLPSFRLSPESTQPNPQEQPANSSLMATATPPVTPASLPSFRRKPESTHPNPQGQRVNSPLRPTTETAEACKGRGPRLSPGRRSRVGTPSVIPAKAGIHVASPVGMTGGMPE